MASTRPDLERILKGLIRAASGGRPKTLAVACPNQVVLEAVRRALREGIIEKAHLAGDPSLFASGRKLDPRRFEIIERPAGDPDFHAASAEARSWTERCSFMKAWLASYL